MEQEKALYGQEGMPEGQLPEENESPESMSMEELLASVDVEVKLPRRGEIHEGEIASISDHQILVSLGAKSAGVISGRELEAIPPEELEALEVGQKVPVYVLSPEDANGNVVLSYTRAKEQKAWKKAEALRDSGEIYEGTIDGFNKGGLIVRVFGLRGFVPASQIAYLRRVQATGDTPEARWKDMVGEPIRVRVVEVNRQRRRLILSERAASSESRQEIKERVLAELEEGQVYTGRVTSLADFGAFVNIKGADGLVHLSELSWERVSHPREVLQVGQEVQVQVISVDRENQRIGLSIRRLQPDPWLEKIKQFQTGQLVQGTITRLTKFGAFARIADDIEGLIHISEISDQHIEHPREALQEGEEVTLRIIRIQPEERRIGLSIRKVDSAAYVDKDMKLLEEDLRAVLGQDETAEEPAQDEAEEA